MLNIPDAIKSLYQQDTVRKNFRVQFPNGELPDITNANVLTESVRFTESLCSQQYLRFGLTEASEIQFETIGIPNMMGMTIKCFSEIDTSSLTAAQISAIQAMSDLDGELVLEADSDLTDYYGNKWGFYRVPYGTFTVDSCPRNHGAMTHRRVTAYSNAVTEDNVLSPFYRRYFSNTLLISKYYVTPGFVLANLFGKMSGERWSKRLTPLQVNDIPATSTMNVNGATLTITGSGWSMTLAPYFNYSSYALSYVPHYGVHGTSHLVHAVDADGIISGKATYNDYILPVIRAAIEDGDLTGTGYDLAGASYTLVKDNTATDSDGSQITVSGTFSSADEAYGFIFDNIAYAVPYVRWSNGGHKWFFVPVNKENYSFAVACDESMNTPTYTLVAPKSLSFITVSITDSGTQSGGRITPSESVPIITSYTETIFDMDDAANMIFPDFSSMLTVDGKKVSTGIYTYEGEMDLRKIVEGLSELCGGILKTNRHGEYALYDFSNADAEAIVPSEYSELWWDEYDVDPIGSIIYTFHNDEEDEDQTVTYAFSENESVYEMKDNYLLKNMTGLSMASVNTLLDTYFIPNITGVNFTPIDLDMIGLPYIESGDHLTVTAEDGVTVSSYVLRHTIKGIQALQDSIESTNGELLTSEEVED